MWRTSLTGQRALVHGLDDLVAGIKDVRAPALILADPADPMVPVATAQAVRDLLPGGRLRLIGTAGTTCPGVPLRSWPTPSPSSCGPSDLATGP